MNSEDLVRLFRTHLHHLYDDDEIRAMARVYVEDMRAEIGDIDAGSGFAERIITDLKTLAEGCPLQYVTGLQYFRGRPFKINRSVLIPRPETEEMTDLIISRCSRQRGRILDIGTGSGCIAITLALDLTGLEVTATDLSLQALELARLNGMNLNAGVEWITDDITQTGLNDRFWDIIVSNPPYIPISEASSMHLNVAAFEPPGALFVPDKDPLFFYRKIGHYASTHLTDKGELWLEIHHQMGTPIRELFQLWNAEVVIFNDMSGKERFAYITFP